MDEHLIVAHNPWMDRRSWQHTCMDGRMDERLVSWDTHPMDGWVDTTHMHGRMDDNLVSFIRCKPVNTIHHVPIRIRPDVGWSSANGRRTSLIWAKWASLWLVFFVWISQCPCTCASRPMLCLVCSLARLQRVFSYSFVFVFPPSSTVCFLVEPFLC